MSRLLQKPCSKPINIHFALCMWQSAPHFDVRRQRHVNNKKWNCGSDMSEEYCKFFSSLLFPCVGALSQHWGNLILDLRDQHLGQHNACNLEDRSNHFRLQNRLSVTVQPVPSVSRSLGWGGGRAMLVLWIVSLEIIVQSCLQDYNNVCTSLLVELITACFSQRELTHPVANAAFNRAFQ